MDSDIQGLIGAAMSNVIILDRIFSLSPSPQDLRLVCRTWNEVLLSGRPHFSLNIDSIPWDGPTTEEFATLISSLDPRLFKSLTTTTRPISGHHRIKQEEFLTTSKLHTISRMVGSWIQDIDLEWWYGALKTFYYILTRNELPNMARLSFTIRKRTIGFPEEMTYDPNLNGRIGIPTQPNLLEITFTWTSEFDDYKYRPRLVSKYLGALLSAAPNLAKLDLKAPFCPSLSENKALTWLRLLVSNRNLLYLKDHDLELTFPPLDQVLEEVKNTLQYLRVDYYLSSSDMDEVQASRQFRLPVLPKLVHFSTGARSVVGVGANLEQFTRHRLPSLTQLGLSCRDIDPAMSSHHVLEELLRLGGGGRLPKISGLRLEDVDGEAAKLLYKLKKVFPDLKRLDLVKIRVGKEEKAPLPLVGSVLKSCLIPGLVHLRVQLGLRHKMSQLVRDLWDGKGDLFPGLRTLEIINAQVSSSAVMYELRGDDQDKLVKILDMTREMDDVIFRGFMMRSSTARRTLEYVQDNLLPVKFT